MGLPINYTQADWRLRREARNEYISLQKGLCWFCRHPLEEAPRGDINTAYLNMKLFPKGFLDHPVHLHHNHTTGMTIGAVHARCNGYLWQYKGE